MPPVPCYGTHPSVPISAAERERALLENCDIRRFRQLLGSTTPFSDSPWPARNNFLFHSRAALCHPQSESGHRTGFYALLEIESNREKQNIFFVVEVRADRMSAVLRPVPGLLAEVKDFYFFLVATNQTSLQKPAGPYLMMMPCRLFASKRQQDRGRYLVGLILAVHPPKYSVKGFLYNPPTAAHLKRRTLYTRRSLLREDGVKWRRPAQPTFFQDTPQISLASLR